MAMIRLSLAMFLAMFLSATIFWALWSLVHVDIDIGNMRKATRIEFTRMRKDSETATKRDEKPERERPPATPEVPRMSIASGGVESNVMMLAPTLDAKGAMTGINLGALYWWVK